MSSPTINAISSQFGSYPSLLGINNMVRAIINDSQSGATGTPGEGQVYTDNPLISPFVQPMLNSAIRTVYRQLRNIGAPALIKDNVIITGLTPINGPQGLGLCDPAVQVFLSYGGYFDGSTINPDLYLPQDLLYPELVWERQTGTNNPFVKMRRAQEGLPSRPQYPTLSEWEWRQDNIWFVGSTQQRDVRLRYYSALPQYFSPDLDLANTYVPILDSLDALAYQVIVQYARMLESPGLPEVQAEAKAQMFELKNAYTRRTQTQDYMREKYEHSSGDMNTFFLGWS